MAAMVASSQSQGSAGAGPGLGGGQGAEELKLRQDLDVVVEKVQLYAELLAGGLPRGDDTLVDILAFLEACRERLAAVIEAGTLGQLSEELFEASLKVNDMVQQTLEADKNGTILPQSILPPKATGCATGPNLLDLDDQFAGLQFSPAPAHAPAASPAPSLAPLLPISPAPARTGTGAGAGAGVGAVAEPPSPVESHEQANPLFLSGVSHGAAKPPLSDLSRSHAQQTGKAQSPPPDDFDAFLASLK